MCVARVCRLTRSPTTSSGSRREPFVPTAFWVVRLVHGLFTDSSQAVCSSIRCSEAPDHFPRLRRETFMKLKAVVLAGVLALLAASVAVAAPPAGKGKPAATGAGCKPMVSVLLKG